MRDPNTANVAFLVRALDIGGAQRQIVTLAKALHDRGRGVLVVTFYGGGELAGELTEHGVRVHAIGKRGRWDMVGFALRLIRFLRASRVDVLYAYLVESSIAGVVVKPFVPGLRVVWGVRASRMDYDWYGWFPRFAFRIARRLSAHADLIIANSEAGSDFHRQRGYPADRMTVVHNGIDVDRFRPDPAGGMALRTGWGIPASDAVIGVVGRLDPIKDHSTLLRSFALLRKRRVDAWCVVVGSGDSTYEARLRTEAARLGAGDRLRWETACSNVSAVYSACDVICSASLSEGFPNVIAEAMACGVPCVATDVGDTATIMGPFGSVVPPGDPERLAAALQHVLERRTTAGGAACRERIATRFGVEQMVTRTMQLLGQCFDATR